MSVRKAQNQLPYDREAEEATIGALLIDPDAMGRVIATGLQPSAFHLMRLRLIFRAIMQLHEQGKPGDYVLVLSQLKRNGHLRDVGGPAGVTELIRRCPTSIYATHYADVVLACAEQRRVIQLAASAAKAAYASNGSIEDLTKAMQGFLEDADRRRDKPTIQGVLR